MRGKTRRPVPRRNRRNIPIPPGPKLGTGAIRRCGDSTQWQSDATGFHKLVGFWKYASRIGIKKKQGTQIHLTLKVLGNPETEMYRALASPVLTDGTKQGLATFIPVPEKFLIFQRGIKSCCSLLCPSAMPSYDNSCSWSVWFLLSSTCYPRRKLCRLFAGIQI